MRKALPLTVSLLCLSSVCLSLGACGQKGPLYLPSDPPPSQRAPLGDDAGQPADAAASSSSSQ